MKQKLRIIRVIINAAFHLSQTGYKGLEINVKKQGQGRRALSNPTVQNSARRGELAQSYRLQAALKKGESNLRAEPDILARDKRWIKTE